MMPSDAPLPEIFQGRLHPLTLVLSLVATLRRLIIPAIPLLAFGDRRIGPGLLILLMALSVGRALVRYFTFSYRIENGELVTREGVLQRTERHIPLERVQEIRVEQGVLHRVFGVVDANVETAGGQGPEASLSVLSRAEAERLRQAVFARAALTRSATEATAAVAHEDAPAIVRRLGVHDLVWAGLTSNHLLTACVVMGALWAFVDDVLPENIYERVGGFLFREAERLWRGGVETAALVVVAGVAAFLLVAVILSVIGTVVLFFGFTLSRAGEDLHRAYGLLTRRSSSLPRRRIQVLEIEEKLLRRLARRATLRADITGGVKKAEDDNKGRDVLLPIVRRDEVDGLLPLFLPDLEAEPPDWRRVSRLAIRRGTLKGGLLCTALAVGLTVYYGNAIWLWPLALVPLVYAVNVLRYQTLGYALGERFFWTRRGWLGRSTHIVPVRKAQAVEVRQTPFDRRLGLATLVVDTAGQAYTGGGPRIGNLPLEEARALARVLTQKAAAVQFKL